MTVNDYIQRVVVGTPSDEDSEMQPPSADQAPNSSFDLNNLNSSSCLDELSSLSQQTVITPFHSATNTHESGQSPHHSTNDDSNHNNDTSEWWGF